MIRPVDWRMTRARRCSSASAIGGWVASTSRKAAASSEAVRVGVAATTLAERGRAVERRQLAEIAAGHDVVEGDLAPGQRVVDDRARCRSTTK